MKKYHPIVFDATIKKEKEIKADKQSGLSELGHSYDTLKKLKYKSIPAIPTYSKDSIEYKNISRKLAIYIGCTSVSLQTVCNKHLLELIHCLNPAYPVPGISGIAKEIDGIFLEMKAKIKSHLALARKISFCVDNWTKKAWPKVMWELQHISFHIKIFSFIILQL
jgi:hypothetical protein